MSELLNFQRKKLGDNVQNVINVLADFIIDFEEIIVLQG